MPPIYNPNLAEEVNRQFELEKKRKPEKEQVLKNEKIKEDCESLEKVLVFSSEREIFVLDNEKSVKIASRSDYIWALCSHDGELYDAGSYNKIFETLSGKEVASRSDYIPALCSNPRKYFVDAGMLKF